LSTLRTHSARLRLRAVEDQPPLRWLIRAGFIARGLTYGIIGGLALALAAGAGTAGAAPNQQGALSLIARSVAGKVALIAVAAGLLAYAIWKLTQAIVGRGPEGGGSPKLIDRIGNFAAAVIYVGFFAVAIRALTGSGGNASQQPSHDAGGVLGWPGGQVLVGLAGFILIGVSVYQAYDGLSGHFAHESKTREMGAKERRAFMGLGRVGLTARALVFVLIGYFLVQTAIEFDPRKAVGVDGALGRLHHQAFGPWLVGLVGVGLVVFALYSMLEGRFRRL
jgi:hypothetical protein